MLLFAPLLAVAVELQESDLAPYLEKYAIGWIDWDNGYIYGIGQGFLDANHNSRPRAVGAARVQAAGNIVKLAAGLHLDDRRTLQSLGSGRVVIELKASLHYEEVNKEYVKSNQPHFKVVYRVPLHGVSGLTYRLLSGLKAKRSLEWSSFPREQLTRESYGADLPWLVLDARQFNGDSGPKPALFPKIVSSRGETIYELKQVEQDSLLQRGMASYVHTRIRGDISSTASTSFDRLLDELNDILSPAESWAEDTERRPKREKFIVKKVENLRGLTRTNLVISEKDAQELKREDAASQILQKCRVIIIVSSPIGGIEAHFVPILAQVH